MACSKTTETVRAPWSSRGWIAYYRTNGKNLMALPWKRGAELTPEEREAIAASLQDFQLGESSEGKHLLERARAYSENHDPDYLEAMQLFIREEQRHARDLGTFLRLAEIPLLERTRLDSIFRWLRRLAGLELSITVLVTAETIGKVYYQAIRRATGSILLRRLCEQLLRDEAKHTRFHAERLAMLRKDRAGWRVWLARAGHRLLFAGASLAVWLKHRRALRAGGLGFVSFLQACRKERKVIFRQMDPAKYRLVKEGRPSTVRGINKDLQACC
jgi:hypothetical protein